MARFTKGASPGRSETTPTSGRIRPPARCRPHEETAGVTMNARSSMYSHDAENRRRPRSCSPPARGRRPRHADRARAGAGHHVARVAEAGGRPRPRAREAHHPRAPSRDRCDEQRGHHAAVAQLRLDGLGVDDEIADGDHVAARVEDHAAADAARASRCDDGASARAFTRNPTTGRLHPPARTRAAETPRWAPGAAGRGGSRRGPPARAPRGRGQEQHRVERRAQASRHGTSGVNGCRTARSYQARNSPDFSGRHHVSCSRYQRTVRLETQSGERMARRPSRAAGIFVESTK